MQHTDVLALKIEALFESKPTKYSDADCKLFAQFKQALNAGTIRAAEPDEHSATGWRVNKWVKQGILVGFRMGTR